MCLGSKQTLQAKRRKWHFGTFACLDCVCFRVQFDSHLGEGLARIIIPRDSAQFAALLGAHAETIGLGTHGETNYGQAI